ncbi:MAG TPA: bacterioferritin [Terriglobales bacterium]|jgi:bacterioferritin|nr:bacterioferritin [Terriglobales bacterium]
MKGNEQVITVLNQVLRKELTGINQYFIHAKMCANWGYHKLKKVLWDESLGEMKHADQVMERILFLEGTPNISAYDKIMVGTDVKRQLENDLALELAALTILRPGIKNCREASDDASRELLEHILVDEEKHVDWIETQLHQIDEVGYQNYLAQQMNDNG